MRDRTDEIHNAIQTTNGELGIVTHDINHIMNWNIPSRNRLILYWYPDMTYWNHQYLFFFDLNSKFKNIY